jgi:molybdopterin/thiamine biosynthesis adenylyltransferase
MIFSYQDLTSRNYIFINDALQMKIKQTKLVFAGCGLSSTMIEIAARIGFEQFALVDSDNVELSNLNRQAYFISDCKQKKVDALEKKLLDINPNVSVTLFRQGIQCKEDVDLILRQGNIIINTIDYGSLYFHLVHQGMKENKLIICPFNPGFGGLVVCFNICSGTLFDLLNTKDVECGAEFSKKLIMNNLEIQIPAEMRNNLDSLFNNICQRGYDPQIVIGVTMSSSIGLSCIIKYLSGEKIPFCPTIIFRGLY